MDIRKVKKLIELLDDSGIAEIEITEGEESVRISRYPAAGAPIAAPPFAAHAMAAPAPAAAPAGDDLMAKLQQLADMKAAGILDDAEFAAAKAKLLG